MKKIFLVLCVVLISSSGLVARKVTGYFISKSNDTVHVTFIIPVTLLLQEPDYEKIQWKVKYFASDKKRKILRPSMATEIVFSFEGDKVKMLSRENNLRLRRSILSENSNVFLLLVKEGKVKLFKYYKRQSSAGMYNPSSGIATPGSSFAVEQYIMQRGNEGLFRARALWFRKDMVNYLEDCPDLAHKIEDRIFVSEDIEGIIDEYNWLCR